MTIGREKRKTIKIQRPVSMMPWAMNPENKDFGNVWIKMKPSKILDQYSKAQGDVATEELNEEFIFLAPLSMNENIVHHWEAYESVASRLAQKIRSAVKLGAEGAAMTKIWEKKANLASDAQAIFENQGGNVGTSVENFVRRTYNAMPGSRIPKIKIDTPLYYTNSDRRQIVLEFQLFHENINTSNPLDVLVNPIQKLMKYSSPDLDPNSDINIQFPYMWEIETLPTAFIKYTTCALTGVQPTWNAPYIGQEGVPASVNLQLTFMDMSPLYRETIESGSVINILTRNQNNAMKRQNQFTQSAKTTQQPNLYESKHAGQAQQTKKASLQWTPHSDAEPDHTFGQTF